MFQIFRNFRTFCPCYKRFAIKIVRNKTAATSYQDDDDHQRSDTSKTEIERGLTS